MLVDVDADSSEMKIPVQPKEMLSWSVAPDGRQHFRINFSSLSLMQECQRKTEYSLVRKLRSNLESPATLFGTAIHKALEVYYSGQRSERILPPDYRATMDMIGVGQWQPEWSESLVFRAAAAFVEKASALRALPDTDKHSVHCGVWLLRYYFERYVDDEYTIVRDANGPMVERKFSMTLFADEKIQIEMFGTIDAVMKSELTGAILITDHKTTSSLYDFYDAISPNHQYTCYLLAGREVFGFDTDSFLVNAIQKKTIPKTARGSGPDFARQVTNRTEDDFQELKDAIMLNVSIFRANMESNTWPMTAPGPCSKYGGCQFRQICASPKQLRENIITAQYRSHQ
jgi:hypothetical protein